MSLSCRIFEIISQSPDKRGSEGHSGCLTATTALGDKDQPGGDPGVPEVPGAAWSRWNPGKNIRKIQTNSLDAGWVIKEFHGAWRGGMGNGFKLTERRFR